MNRRVACFALAFVVGCGSTSDPGDGRSERASGATPRPADGAPTDGSTETETPPPNQAAVVRVHYPAGTGVVALTGHEAPFLGSTSLKSTANDTWELDVGVISAPLSFTPTRDGKAAKGPPYVVHPGQTLDVYPYFDADHGKVDGFEPQFHSNILNNDHMVRMYLPPSYPENTRKRYPVIYMHDAQAIFDADLGTFDSLAKSAFGSWGTDTELDSAIAAGEVPEVIVIGLDMRITFNPDPTRFFKDLMAARLEELTPTPDDAFADTPGTGQGPQYLRMIAEELKPYVDGKLRTIPDREHTFMMGSSLGGLISVWAGLEHGDVFGGVASLSTATYWDDEVVVSHAAGLKTGLTTTPRMYVDTGRDERDDSEMGPLMPTEEKQARLVEALKKAGYVEGDSLRVVVDPIGTHNGESWHCRLPGVLPYLLGSWRWVDWIR